MAVSQYVVVKPGNAFLTRQARALRDGLFGTAGGRHSCSKKAGQLTGKRVLVIGAGPVVV